MNWLKNFVRPKLRELVGGRKDIPEDLWRKCDSCSEMIFHRDLEKDLQVCQHCGRHMRLSAGQRLKMLFDDGRYQMVEQAESIADPLKFRDRRKYADRLKEARAKSEAIDALAIAHGRMGGMGVVIAALDFGFLGGSMGVAVGNGLLTAARLAVVQDAPLIVIPSSGGARMQEGVLSLMQMARTTIAVEELKEAGLPYIVVLTDPTTGGVSASFAMLGDIAIAEPGAVIGFAGARVIEQTIRETLPDGFQRAEYLLEHGMVDMVVHRHQLRDTLIRIISLLRNTGPAAEVLPLAISDVSESDQAASDPAPSDQTAADPAPSDPAPSDQTAADQTTADQTTADKAASDKASDKAASEKAASNKATSEKATSNKATSNKAGRSLEIPPADDTSAQ